MKTKILSSILILLLITIFSVNSNNQITNSNSQPIWPMYKYNMQRTGKCPYDTTNNLGKLKWKFESDYEITHLSVIETNSPVIGSDGTIYFCFHGYDSEHNIEYHYALKPDGTLKWKFKTEKTHVTCNLSIGNDGTIYYGFRDPYAYGAFALCALNPDASIKWQFRTDGVILSSPAFASDGTIYFGSDDNYLYALNSDGTLKWKFKTDSDIRSSPAIGSDGTIYFGSDDNYLYALKPDGTLKWKFKTDSDIFNTPLIHPNGKIYIFSGHYLYQIDQFGNWEWKKKFDFLYWRAIDISIDSNGNLIFATPEEDHSYMNSFNINTRDFNWRKFFPRLTTIYTPIISKEDTIYFGEENYFYALYPDGNVKFKYETGGKINSYAISSDGTIYVGSEDGYLYAFGWYIKLKSPQGGEKWEAGKNYQIKWNTASTGGYVKIYYSLNSSSTWNKITCVSNNTTAGVYNWNIPSNINTDKARIKVEHTDSCQDNALVYESDVSKNDFTIKSNNISITSFTNNINSQNYRFDFSVNWITSGIVTGGKIRIIYKLDTFDRWHFVDCVENDGTHNWSIPFQNINCAPNFKVLLEWVDKCGDTYILYARAESQEFKLLPKIKLIQPNGGEILEPGNITPYQIKWNYEGSDNPFVKIYYSLDSGNSFTLIDCKQIAQSGVYNWNIPEDLETTKGRIKITYSYSCSPQAFEFCPNMSNKDFTLKTKEAQDSNLSAKGYCGFVYLEWNKVEGADRYWIYRGIGEGNEESMPLTDFPIKENYYKDTKNLIEGKKYCYIVKAVDINAKEFAKSNEACATPTCSSEIPQEECKLILKYQIGNTYYWVNGVQKGPMLTAPILRWDRTFLIIRHVVEEVEGTISWDGVNQLVTIVTKEDKKIEFQIGNKMYKTNGVSKQIDPYNPNVVPFIQNGRTLIPLRVTGDELNAKEINWYGDKNIAELIFTVPCPEKLKGRIDVLLPENCTNGTYIEIVDLYKRPITIIKEQKGGLYSTNCTLTCPGSYIVSPINPNCKFTPSYQQVDLKDYFPAYKRVEFYCGLNK